MAILRHRRRPSARASTHMPRRPTSIVGHSTYRRPTAIVPNRGCRRRRRIAGRRARDERTSTRTRTAGTHAGAKARTNAKRPGPADAQGRRHLRTPGQVLAGAAVVRTGADHGRQLDAAGCRNGRGRTRAGVRRRPVLRQGRLRDSITGHTALETIAHQIDDTEDARPQLVPADERLRRAAPTRGREVPHRSAAAVRATRRPRGQANVLNNLGVDATESHSGTKHVPTSERSRELRDEAGDVDRRSDRLAEHRRDPVDQGHLDEAEQLFNEAIRSWRRSGYEVGIAVATSYSGRLQARRGDYALARTMLAEAVERFEKIGASHFVRRDRGVPAGVRGACRQWESGGRRSRTLLQARGTRRR